MSKKNEEPKPPFRIHPADLVRGEVFLKFLADYKKYDATQKEIIKNQRTVINTLKMELSYYNAEVPDGEDEKADKIRRQTKAIAQLENKIAMMRCEIETLKSSGTAANG